MSLVTCREMVDRLSDYIDGDLEAGLRRLIDDHKGECPPCRAFVRSLALTVRAVRALPGKPIPEALRRSLRAAVRAARRSAPA
jgi:predicted anti-sigma-YlaC factor YlaD